MFAIYFANWKYKLNYKLRACIHLKKMGEEDWCFNHFKGGGNGGDLGFELLRDNDVRSLGYLFFLFLGILC